MVWIAGLVILILVAKHTIWGCVGIIPCCMALGTVLYIVPLGKGEEVVVYHGRRPSWICGMAGGTIRGKSAALVIWILGSRIVILVAGHTIG